MPSQDDVEATKVVSALLSYMYVHLTGNNFNGEKGGGSGGGGGTNSNQQNISFSLPSQYFTDPILVQNQQGLTC